MAFLDNNGNPMNGGLLFSYSAGLSSKIATYTDSTGATPNTNPVVLDFRGEANVWLDSTLTYKFTLAPAGDKDPPTKPIWTVDNISAGITFASLTAQIIGQILYPRTAAEIAAGVTPTNYFYPYGYLRRYGGAPGAGDNSTAMNSCVAALVASGGGIVEIDICGEWRMNVTIAADNIKIRMPEGRPEYDVNCLRPFNIATGPAVTWGSGTTDYRYCGMINCSVSGTNGTSGADKQSAKSASHAILLKGGMTSFFSLNSYYYNGIRTIGLEPTTTNAVTGTRFIGGGARNDLTDSVLARTIYGMRQASAAGFYTDNVFSQMKLNGPGDITTTNGYLAEFDGTLAGIFGEFDYCYADSRPDVTNPTTVCHGVLLKGSAGIRSTGLTLDPFTTGVPIVETDQALSDVGRYLFGEIRQGGQRMKFAGPTFVDLPVEAEYFSYRQRLSNGWQVGPRYVQTEGTSTQYKTTVSWQMQSTTGPDRLTGASIETTGDVNVFGGNASQSGFLTAVSGAGGLYLGASGSNQNIRVVPSGTGAVLLEGSLTRPSGDNTQDLGASGNRWKVVYAGTGAINTSDERVKDEIDDIPQSWLDAWSEVEWQRFKFKDALAIKGDGARWHIGLIAQRVIAAFKKHGLDATELGIVCYDEWADEFEDVREEYVVDGIDGPITMSRFTGEKKLIRPAGNLFAIRYDEALAMECAYLRSRIK